MMAEFIIAFFLAVLVTAIVFPLGYFWAWFVDRQKR